MKNILSICASLALGTAAACNLGAAAPSLAGQTRPVSVECEVVVSGDAEMKGGGSIHRHIVFAQTNTALSRTIATGETGTFILGLSHSLSIWRVSGPAGWEDDDFWKEYKQTHPDWDRVPIPKQLHSLSASIDWSRTMADRWTVSASLAEGSHVGGAGLLSHGWGTCASVMGLYEYSPDLTLAFGAAYDSLSHDFKYVPIVGFDWRFAKRWSAALGFPSTSVTFRMNDRISFALEVSGSGGTYHVEKDPEPGVAPRSLAGSKLETMEVRLGFRVDWRINDTFSVNATAGNVLYREYKYIDRGFKLRSHDAPSFIAVGGRMAF